MCKAVKVRIHSKALGEEEGALPSLTSFLP